jgi:tetratricopeptide (TPR) repeat protein
MVVFAIKNRLLWATGLACSAILLLLSQRDAALAGGDNVDSIVAQAKSLADAGKLGLSILEYDRAISLQPGSHELYRSRGLSYLRMGRLEKAIDDFDHANEELGPYREQKFPGLGGYLDWQRAHERYLEGNRELGLGHYDGAIALYRDALSIYSTFPQCLHNLGIAYGKKGDHEEAALLCMEAISYRHVDWKFWKTLAIELHSQGKYITSLHAMEHAKELDPPTPEEVEIIEGIEVIKDSMQRHRVRTL